MLIAAGFAVALMSWPVALVLALGFAVIYVPVIASDAPQLAAAVASSVTGVVVPRTVDAWSAAVTSELPSPPLPEPSNLESVGRAHLALYRELLAKWA